MIPGFKSVGGAQECETPSWVIFKRLGQKNGGNSRDQKNETPSELWDEGEGQTEMTTLRVLQNSDNSPAPLHIYSSMVESCCIVQEAHPMTVLRFSCCREFGCFVQTMFSR